METIINSRGRNAAQRYVDILSDAGFKAVFGNQKNKQVLIDLINAILPPDRTVRELSYSTTEIPGFTLANKSVRLDLRCTGHDGRKFIVEVQCYSQEHFFRRCVEYAAKVYDSGSLKGGNNRSTRKRLAENDDTPPGYDIPPVYFIGLLNADLMSFRDTEIWSDRFVSEYTFREKLSHDVQDETIFLMLNRFRKPLGMCSSLIDKWCFALKHVNGLDALPEGMKTEVFERFFEACEIARFDADTKLNYEKDMVTERDYYNIISTARKTGKAEGMSAGLLKGREEGLIEGQSRERINIAKAMKSKGLSSSMISDLTGLSESEIAAL